MTSRQARRSGHQTAGESATKECRGPSSGRRNHLIELSNLFGGPRQKGSLSVVGRAKVRAAMPESPDLIFGRAFPFRISARDGEGKNTPLVVVDLFGQLSTLSAVISRFTRKKRFRRRRRNGHCRCQEQNDDRQDDVWKDPGHLETKLHTRCIGPGR
jgi:hypothetical protein